MKMISRSTRRLVFITSTLMMLIAGMSGSTAIAAGMSTNRGMSDPAVPAKRLPLTNQNVDCEGTPIPPNATRTEGFAIVRTTGAGEVNTTVVVQRGTPNTTYNIRLIQVPNDDCGGIDGTVTTDNAGFGATNVQEPKIVQGPATGVFVVLNNQNNPANDFLTTPVTRTS